jgi:hypothetical protein
MVLHHKGITLVSASQWEVPVGLKVRKLSPEMAGAELGEELATLERRHSMTSWDFYERYRAGELEDSDDFARWATLCYLAVRTGVLRPPAAGHA